MSRRQKIVLACLVLILLAFVGVLFLGARQPRCAGSAADCARRSPAGTAMKRLGGLFPAAGRVTLPQPRYTVGAGQAQAIALDAGHGLRVLKIALQAGQSMRVRYVDQAPGKLPHAAGEPAAPQEGDVPGDAASPDDPRVASFTVSSAGGTLTVTCQGAQPCVVVQH